MDGHERNMARQGAAKTAEEALKDQLEANKHVFATRDGYIAELEKLYAVALKCEDVQWALHLLDKIRNF